MASTKNPMEAMVYDLAEEYVDIVDALLDEMAPFSPWWSQELTPDQKLWRYLEVRDEMLPWLVEVGIYMGLTTFGDLLDRLDDIWLSQLPLDVAPAGLLAQVPMPLLELVQAAPLEAAQHIRDMENLIARRSTRKKLGEPGPLAIGKPELPTQAPEVNPDVVPSFGGRR